MRICFFGESYVNGTGDPAYQGWVGRLCALAKAEGHDLTAYNCGIRGAASSLIRETWFSEACARHHPDEKFAVVFSYGTNDGWRDDNNQPRVPLETQMDNTFAILELAQSRWPTLFVGPPDLPTYAAHTLREADHAARCQRTQTICAELGVPYFDTLSVFGQFRQWRTEAAAGDGAHPGAQGYAEMADALSIWPAWRALLQTA